jgi:hypothetical protein
MVYDLIPLFGGATDVWANRTLSALLPVRNSLIFAGIGGWMLGSGLLWSSADTRLPKVLGWVHIAAGSPWVGLAIISWGMAGGTGKISELPSFVMVTTQGLFLLLVLGYFGWALTFGLWLQEQSGKIIPDPII